VGAASAVGVHDDLAAGESGVSRGPSDHELSGGIDVEGETAVEKSPDVGRERFHQARQNQLAYIFLYTRVHGFVRVELVMLGAEYNGVYAYGLVGG